MTWEKYYFFLFIWYKPPSGVVVEGGSTLKIGCQTQRPQLPEWKKAPKSEELSLRCQSSHKVVTALSTPPLEMLLMCLEWHVAPTECQRSLGAAPPSLLSGCFISICQPADKAAAFSLRHMSPHHLSDWSCPPPRRDPRSQFPSSSLLAAEKPGSRAESRFTFAAEKNFYFCRIFLKLTRELGSDCSLAKGNYEAHQLRRSALLRSRKMFDFFENECGIAADMKAAHSSLH